MSPALRYIEREAREQGEADYRTEMLAKGLCFECGGEGYEFDWTGARGAMCYECKGTGKDLRGCEWCGITHHIQQCPAIAFYRREG